MSEEFDNEIDQEDSLPGFDSKSAKKRELMAIQETALKMMDLSLSDFNSLSLDAEVRREVELTRSIKAHSARRRSLRHLIRIIFDAGHEEVKLTLVKVSAGKKETNRRFHEIEKMRDAFVAGKDDAVEVVMEKYPSADRQRLKNLARNIKKEKSEAGVVRQKRVIFQYLRELSES
jgi:ribosome-associated protein